MNNRAFVAAFAASAACHALLLLSRLIQLWQLPLLPPRTASDTLHVVYERAPEDAKDAAQLQRALSGSGLQNTPGLLGAVPRVRVADRSIGLPLLPSEARRQSVVDLTNIIEAAQGDPVLLSYFGALRERIQRTANQRRWVGGDMAQGIIYVAFTLSEHGQVQSVSVVQERSAAAPHLQEAALGIVRSAGPFPPFPPSMDGGAKTIVVPLEFLLNS